MALEAAAPLTHAGWRADQGETSVNWCGHGQEVIPVPDREGGVWLIPVLGEAT